MRFLTLWLCDQQSLRSACSYAQSDQSLCWWLEYSMTVNLLTGYQLEYLSLKEGCTSSSHFTLVQMLYCWKSHVMVYNIIIIIIIILCLNKRAIYHTGSSRDGQDSNE